MSELYPNPAAGSAPSNCAAPSNGMGVTGLVTGIVGASLAWVPGLGIILGILGVVFGSLGWYYANQGRATNKGMSIAGLTLGIFAIAFWPILIIIVAVASPAGTA